MRLLRLNCCGSLNAHLAYEARSRSACVCCAPTRRAATQALRKKTMGNLFAGLSQAMDDWVAQMNATVQGIPEDLVKVRCMCQLCCEVMDCPDLQHFSVLELW